MEYKVEACVSISGPVEVADVRATLKLEYEGGKVTYAGLARCACASLLYVLKRTQIFEEVQRIGFWKVYLGILFL